MSANYECFNITITTNNLVNVIYRDPHNTLMKDRVTTEGNSIQVKGENGWSLIERMFMDLRAARSTERNCDPALFYIPSLESCLTFHELMYTI
jgi:hypothetical protein